MREARTVRRPGKTASRRDAAKLAQHFSAGNARAGPIRPGGTVADARRRTSPVPSMRSGALSRRNPRSGRLRLWRFILLSAAHCRDRQVRTWHRKPGGIFSGCWVNGPNGRWMLAGPYPLHDAGTFFAFSYSSYAVSCLRRFFVLAWPQATCTGLNATRCRSILKMLRSSMRATIMRAMFVPCLSSARSKASR